jgi:hypothetical protein
MPCALTESRFRRAYSSALCRRPPCQVIESSLQANVRLCRSWFPGLFDCAYFSNSEIRSPPHSQSSCCACSLVQSARLSRIALGRACCDCSALSCVLAAVVHAIRPACIGIAVRRVDEGDCGPLSAMAVARSLDLAALYWEV